MTSQWEILTGEFRIQSLAHRTVKANPKPGGLVSEWSRTSPGHIESTSHIPGAFTVCPESDWLWEPESIYVWGKEKSSQTVCARRGDEFKSRQKICGTVWQEQITNSLSLWPQTGDHDSTSTADLDMCLSAMSKTRHENTWAAQSLRAHWLSTIPY